MNTSIVIALPKIEDAKKIRTVLNRYGFTVAAVCNSGANALASISELDGGVLLCGYHLQDMYYRDLLDYMPDYLFGNPGAALGNIALLCACESAMTSAKPQWVMMTDKTTHQVIVRQDAC